MKADLCPVCKGKGKLLVPNEDSDELFDREIGCHGCGSKGWVQVSE